MLTNTFNQLADVYEAMIDWPKRLAAEEPFYRHWFQQAEVKRVADVACGTGHHAAMFHGWHLDVEASDLSPAMIERARAGFGEPPGLHWAVRVLTRRSPRPGRGMRSSAWETPWPWRPTWRRCERPSPGCWKPCGRAVSCWCRFSISGGCRTVRASGRSVSARDCRKATYWFSKACIVATAAATSSWSLPIPAAGRSWLTSRRSFSAWKAANWRSWHGRPAPQVQFFGGYAGQPYDRVASLELVMVARR